MAYRGALFILGLTVFTVIAIILITSLSFVTSKIEKRMLFPLTSFFISILLFIVSFVVGGWEGIGLDAVSIALFAASAIFFIEIVLFYKVSSSNNKLN